MTSTAICSSKFLLLIKDKKSKAEDSQVRKKIFLSSDMGNLLSLPYYIALLQTSFAYVESEYCTCPRI
jgi:hypothetical protein